MNKTDLAKHLAPTIRNLEKITNEAVSITVRMKDGDFLVGDFSQRKGSYIVELSPNSTPCFTELNGRYSSYEKVQAIFKNHRELLLDEQYDENKPDRLEPKITVYWRTRYGAWNGVVKVPMLKPNELPQVYQISYRKI
jgi:hypothetical protein